VADTNIEWATKVWNPGRGCRRVSAGCGGAAGVGGCYAERQAIRHSGPGGHYEGLVRMSPSGPRWTGEARFVPGKLGEPLAWRGHERVFVDSMSDLFYEGFTNEEIAAVFGVMAACPQHEFLVLTKRPARAREWFKWLADAPGLSPPAGVCAWSARAFLLNADLPVPAALDESADGDDARWPLPNVWLGVSVEDQTTADERIPILLGTPAALRFVSAEPLLGPVDMARWMWPTHWSWDGRFKTPEEAQAAGAYVERKAQALVSAFSRFVDWVIVGGESGPGARPFDLDWGRDLVRDCAAAGAACFVKQLGAVPVTVSGATGNFRTHKGERQVELTAERLVLADRKGGDPAEWPEDLRVRQFPTVRPVMSVVAAGAGRTGQEQSGVSSDPAGVGSEVTPGG